MGPKGSLSVISRELGAQCVSPACWPPVSLPGDLCTKRMNVHLVLHLHNISGSMSLSTQLTTVMGKGFRAQ